MGVWQLTRILEQFFAYRPEKFNNSDVKIVCQYIARKTQKGEYHGKAEVWTHGRNSIYKSYVDLYRWTKRSPPGASGYLASPIVTRIVQVMESLATRQPLAFRVHPTLLCATIVGQMGGPKPKPEKHDLGTAWHDCNSAWAGPAWLCRPCLGRHPGL